MKLSIAYIAAALVITFLVLAAALNWWLVFGFMVTALVFFLMGTYL